ncbi:hypothetical protein LCGC14_1238860 [marine sediment metagenome]|uniref:site-specific DNA-methyltransferase (adenine-specific) n=2 Tax=root TaxID=1 RepID=A0A831VP20_9FLAO|nr:restriction endonuclease subunit M [Pricia antarctica]
MSLFQSSVLNKYLATQDAEQVANAYNKYLSYFLNKEIQQNIRNSKEEQFQQKFLMEFFVNVFGYTMNPDANFNLTTELKNIKDAKKTDGAILKADGAAIAVIELKGTNTKNLTKVTDQAFNYKNNQPDCVYVITSNFEKLRFYVHNAVEHEEFNLFTLTAGQFKLLWLLLQKDNLLNGIPAKVKEESLLQEEKITKALYADYSAFKSALWEDMVLRNPQHEPLLLYKKSQKLLDRFLFIFFSEDKGLLPPNSISIIVKQWKQLNELDEYKPLYSRFKKYFGYMNDGYKGTKYKIHAYNGGLFKTDQLLDGLLISDAILENYCIRLTNYDFADEVDTNILGHIFEHSLNDIENVRAQLAGEEVDKSKTKRKKDGVFYTPKYITKYIIDNTIGVMCQDKKTEIGIDDLEFAKDRKGRKRATIKRLDTQLKQYRGWLLKLTICDPACGSGAFLNQALEFLIAEHRYVDELEAQLFEGSIVFQDVENHILESNIYGVDINEESVEIARLSLWLRTAQKGRKLTSLSRNIKCGNSLIDDPEVAGDLAFNWQDEFSNVFAKGGFDVVIGNPPYVSMSEFPIEVHELFKKKYSSIHTGYNDLMYYFLYIGLAMLKAKGSFGVITSNYFIGNEYAKGIRNYLANHLKHIINFENYHVFKDANVHTAIVIADKTPVEDSVLFDTYASNDTISEIVIASNYYERVKLRRSDLVNNWVIADNDKLSLLKKLNNGRSLLGEISEIVKGPETGNNEVFTLSTAVIDKFNIEEGVLRKCIKNSDIHKYSVDYSYQYVIYADNDFSREMYPNAYHYLEQNKEVLLNRRGPKTGEYAWWRLHRPSNKEVFDSAEKILVPYRAQHNRFGYDDKQLFNNGGDVRAIRINSPKFSTKFIVAVLNSTLINWFYGFIGKPKGNSREYFNKPLSLIPIPEADVYLQESVCLLVDEILMKKEIYQKLENNFSTLLQTKFSLPKPSKNLKAWPSLNFKGFLAELKKAKVYKLSLDEEAEWMAFFNKKKSEANALELEIKKIDKKIDNIVYSLFGLKEDEIKLVEDC